VYEGAVRNLHLTDDDLWCAIADNTNALSVLIEEQSTLDAGLGASDPDTRQELLLFNVQAINKYHREYKDYIAEVRRRYPSI
jgi:hypothetical protein